MSRGLLAIAGAFDDSGATAGGSHSPRGDVTEVTGVAVLPAARRRGIGAAVTAALAADARSRGVATVFCSAQSDDVARIYTGVGFRRVGTACIVEHSGLGGGTATKVERETEHGRAVWEVDVRRDSRITEVHVDTATGSVTRVDDDGRDGRGREDRGGDDRGG